MEKKNASKKVVRKRDSNSSTERACKVKYTKKCSILLEKNLSSRKISIRSMIEQMTESRAWKGVMWLTENNQWRLRKEK